MNPNELPSAFRGIRTFTATEVTVLEGNGTVDDPCVEVTYVYDDEGDLLATRFLRAEGWELPRVPRSTLRGDA